MSYASVNEYVEYLTKLLKCDQAEVLKIYCKLRIYEGKKDNLSLTSLHSTIGGKNNTFVDSIRTEFMNANDFKAQWLEGLFNKYEGKIFSGPNGEYQYIILEMMKYSVCKRYIDRFLERTFYRYLRDRKRYKPDENLWEIWFGKNPLFWGLMISPVYRQGKWLNDVSEMRRVNYEYWTVGHILTTGIIVPGNPQPYKFNDLQNFISFYRQIIERLSKSKYEKAIMEKYIKFLQENEDVAKTPLLIPEFRFDKDKQFHKYRVDFAILNPYTRQLIGIELSPQSSHLNVSGINSKTQKQINEDLKAQWEKEMKKRNEFYEQYGIIIITLTDNMLKDMDACFEKIREYLNKRDRGRTSLDEQEKRLKYILKKLS